MNHHSKRNNPNGLVVFSHGKESGPNGSKITAMRKKAEELGFDTESIDYTDCKDEHERVSILNSYLSKQQGDIILVGSSMGGYVSAAASNHNDLLGMFLLCPAVYHYEFAGQLYKPQTSNIAVVHGWDDEIIDYQSSVKFAREFDAKLLLLKDGHRLKNVLPDIVSWFALFLSDCVSTRD